MINSVLCGCGCSYRWQHWRIQGVGGAIRLLPHRGFREGPVSSPTPLRKCKKNIYKSSVCSVVADYTAFTVNLQLKGQFQLKADIIRTGLYRLNETLKPLIINGPHFCTTLFITTCSRLSTRELLEIEYPNFSKIICGLVCVVQCCRLHSCCLSLLSLCINTSTAKH